MRSQKRTLVETPSQKSLSHATQDSQFDTSGNFYLPYQNQRRFTRKNNNASSIEKSKSRMSTQNCQLEISVSTSRNDIVKYSKDKCPPGFVKVNTQLSESRASRDMNQFMEMKGGSFRMLRTRPNRYSNLEETLRISQQKHTSKQSRQTNKSIDSIASKCGAKSNNVAVLRTELQLKEKELMVLEDERRRFRNTIQDMKRKQSSMQQDLNKAQLQIKRVKESFKQNICQLEKKLQQCLTHNKKIQQESAKMKKQFMESQKQKKIMQRQLNAFINKQVPKNIRELQSCRQVFLQQTIEELKTELNKNKTEVQKDMEYVIAMMRLENIALKDQIKSLEIKNRLYQKKSSDSNRYLQAYTAVKQEYKNVRAALKQANQECELLRSENVKIKKQIKKMNICAIEKRPERSRLAESVVRCSTQMSRVESEKSLNLSLSACSQ